MKGKALAALVAAIATAAAVGGYAWATGGGANVVAACAQTVNGQLRLDTGGGCRPSEEAVSLAAPSATAAAPMYAHVDGGTLDLSRSSGVVSMTATTVVSGGLNTLGVYCFDLVSTPVNVVATGALGPNLGPPIGPTFGSGVSTVGIAGTTGFDGLGCPGNTDAVVLAGLSFGSAPTPGTFYALFQS